MDNGNRYDELLVSYLLNELDIDSEVAVKKWIESSPDNSRYFNELKSSFHLTRLKNIDQLNAEDEWGKFEVKLRALEKEKSSAEHIEVVYPAKRSLIFRVLKITAVAASFIFLLGTGVWFFNQRKVLPISKTITSKASSPLEYLIHHEVNNSGGIKQVSLSDGSRILLSDNSELSYRVPFSNQRRITLTGEAEFKVAKDSTKPFIVISGAVNTTALGTEFKVTAYKNKSSITVFLREGKVVVKTNAGNERTIKDVYLLPGETMVYNKVSGIAKVHKPAIRKPSLHAKVEISDADVPSFPRNVKGSWFMFNNQPLDKVFEELAYIYNVQIVFTKKDVVNRYFIGKFDKSDSVGIILKQISLLNNLKVTKENNRYIVTK